MHDIVEPAACAWLLARRLSARRASANDRCRPDRHGEAAVVFHRAPNNETARNKLRKVQPLHALIPSSNQS